MVPHTIFFDNFVFLLLSNSTPMPGFLPNVMVHWDIVVDGIQESSTYE